MIRVVEAMSPPVSVAPDSTVLQFVDRILPLYRRTAFPVASNKQLYGVLALADLKPLAREDWHKTKVRDVMRPITGDYFVEAETLMSDAQRLMRENGIGAVGVVDADGKLIGFLQRGKVRKRID
jgi:CBS domain-containing protein